ncbi:urease accessory protein UreE [Spirulina sp. CCNP1310]|uniref:urease accessory protein UreE n=1 Tax=Spirulina sp. CCNP1310 TaxID=3110249 RepID=UPI003A4C77C9
MMRFVEPVQHPPSVVVEGEIFRLPLRASDRHRSRHHCQTTTGLPVILCLPRGTVLQDGDWLRGERGEWAQVIAEPEPVLTVTAEQPQGLLRAAYHLGNRHVPLEVTAAYLRLSPDPVLQAMLQQLGVTVIEEICPFRPEAGAYHPSH